MNYFWIRIYDYKKDEELKQYTDNVIWDSYKGTLLDEYYLADEEMTRDQAKEIVKQRSVVSRFAKPRKNDGVYAIVMASEKHFYDRFYVEVDTQCFNPECNNPVKGKLKDFHYLQHNGVNYPCCSYECYRKVNSIVCGYEGEFQEREDYTRNGGVYGYIYHIYNRKTNKHYIGQTIYMPFFRWQEHVKGGLKGDITDLVFETVTEVRIRSQEYINNIEAWWIRKYISDYGKENVMNITVPKITIESLIEQFAKTVSGQLKIEAKEEVEHG